MREITLFQGVLNDDRLEVRRDGVYVVVYNYATCWSDAIERKRFDTIDWAIKWYLRHYTSRAREQGKAWRKEDGNVSLYTPLEYWQDCVEPLAVDMAREVAHA